MKAEPRDRAEVAVVARTAHANGASMAEAVAGHFDMPLRAAYKLIDRARHTGQDIPPARLGPKADKYAAKLQRCADVALAAISAGKPISQEVAAEFKISWKNATALVARARLHGHNIPYDYARGDQADRSRAMLGRVTESERFTITLACADCGATFDTFDPGLLRHVLVEHRRAPWRRERTPVTARAAA